MGRAVKLANVALWTLASAAAHGACVFDANDEIANPFEPGCGDVVLTYTETDNTGNNVALGYPPPTPIASLTAVDGFRTYDALFARHQALLTAHDEVAGAVVGRTVADREIWAYAVGDVDATTVEGYPEPAVLVNGGIHAREWQSPEAVTAVFEALVERKQNASLEQYLIENLTTVLLPVHNVDGLLQTQRYPTRTTAAREQPREGRMRRKNMRNPMTSGAIDENLATVADNFWGVDLNRNFSSGFAQSGRSSASLTSLIYRGGAPNSEPEITALMNAAALGPAARLRLFSDTHSFGQVHFAPTTGNARRDAITAALSARMRAASAREYRYSPDPQGSPGIGSAADHFAFTHQIPAWTFELEPLNGGQDYGGLATHGHSGFILPASEVARMREDVTRMHLLGFYRQMGPPVAIAAQIRDAQSNEVVFDAAWTPSGASRVQQVGVQRAMVAGRTYRLWVAFNKPMRIRDANGAITPYPGQSAGASIGAVALRAPSLSNDPVQLDSNAQWLNQPGGAPTGYLRYADDAFVAEFTIPSTLHAAVATPAVLALNVRDLSELALDANPATAADWGQGHWLGYENAQGAAADEGGPDCTFKPFLGPTVDTAPPTSTAACTTIVVTPDPPPSTPPSPPPSSGGGGGASDVFTWVFVLLVYARARRAARRAPARAA